MRKIKLVPALVTTVVVTLVGTAICTGMSRFNESTKGSGEDSLVFDAPVKSSPAALHPFAGPIRNHP